MAQAKWGVMSHYLADWIARRENAGPMTVERWNGLVDNFDVEALAGQLQSLGAKYYFFTIGQNSGYYCSPNSAYDRIVGINPSKCAHRDLIADLAKALSKRGIRLIVYLPAGAPSGDRQAREKLQWQPGAHPNREFQLHWEQIIREWSNRWGTQVHGWWFDGCYWPNTMYRSADPPNFASFAPAARAGAPRFTVAQAIEFTKPTIQAGGFVTWDVPIQSNGTIAQPFLDQLKAIGETARNTPVTQPSTRPTTSQD
jgi:hypothetical protein